MGKKNAFWQNITESYALGALCRVLYKTLSRN